MNLSSSHLIHHSLQGPQLSSSVWGPQVFSPSVSEVFSLLGVSFHQVLCWLLVSWELLVFSQFLVWELVSLEPSSSSLEQNHHLTLLCLLFPIPKRLVLQNHHHFLLSLVHLRSMLVLVRPPPLLSCSSPHQSSALHHLNHSKSPHSSQHEPSCCSSCCLVSSVFVFWAVVSVLVFPSSLSWV